jgi:fatty-acyl-CoA synthase
VSIVKAQLGADQTAALLYELDNSGHPYGALLTHANLRHVALAVGERMGVTEGDRLLLPVPLYDIFGMVVGSVLSVLHGATLIPFVEFRPRLVLEATTKERGTVLIGTPTMFQQELEEKRFLEPELDSLRAGIMIAPTIERFPEQVPLGLLERVRDELVIPDFTTAFGLRETASVITLSRREDAPGKRRPTAGTPLPDVEVRIVDPSTRTGLAAGETGVLAVRGPSLMKGYYNKPEETSRVMDSGWLYTRQRGSLDPDGSLRLVEPES